jgi:hypothetical protein
MIRPAPLALVLFALGVATTTRAGTVTVEGQAKPTTATVLELVNGDTACYVDLRDDAGNLLHEMADFDICFQEPSLIGRRVALQWQGANVMAESCGGDVDCGRSDRVVLVSAARILDEPAPATARGSFCSAGETVVFACRTGAKLVSVCAAADASPTAGHVQYRFGKPDATPLELELPADRVPPPRAATADNLPFAGGGASWMRFRRGDHAYVVYSGIGQWGPNGEVEERAGVVVERRGQRIAALACRDGRAEGELGPDWFERAGVGAGGEAFELPL